MLLLGIPKIIIRPREGVVHMKAKSELHAANGATAMPPAAPPARRSPRRWRTTSRRSTPSRSRASASRRPRSASSSAASSRARSPACSANLRSAVWSSTSFTTGRGSPPPASAPHWSWCVTTACLRRSWLKCSATAGTRCTPRPRPWSTIAPRALAPSGARQGRPHESAEQLVHLLRAVAPRRIEPPGQQPEQGADEIGHGDLYRHGEL